MSDSNITNIDKGRPPNRGALCIGPTALNTPATMQAYLLARELEALPAHPDATNLSSAAWALLEMIGGYHEAHGRSGER